MDNPLKKKNLIIFSIYLCLIAVIYAQVVFFGKSLLPSLYYPAGTSGTYGYTGRKPVNIFNIDLTVAFYEQPINRLVGDIYLKGLLPLWNPYQGCGVPLAAQYSTRTFFPYQILENISPYWMWDYFMLGRLLIAAFFTYLFLKTLGISIAASFLGGIFYMFSGSMVWFINNEQFTNVAMTLPMVIFYLEKMIRDQNSLSWVLFSIAITLMLLAGQPEVAIYVLVLATAYYFFRILIDRGDLYQFLKKGLKFVLALFLGLGMASIIILPFLEYLSNSYNCHPLGGKMGIADPASLNLIIGLFLPYLTEYATFYRYAAHNGVWDNLGGYLGLSTVYLILSGFFYGKNQYRKYLFFFAIFVFSILLKNFGSPLILWIGRLPMLNQSWSPRWAGPVWTFSLACAGALGLEIILRSPKNKKLFFWIIALCLFCVVLFFYHKIYRPPAAGYVQDFFRVTSPRLKGVILPWSYFKPLLPPLLNGLIVICSVLFTLVFLIAYRKTKKEFILSIILLSILEFWFYIPKGMDASWMILKIIPFAVGILSILLFINEKRIWVIPGIILTLIFATWVDIQSPAGFPERFNPFFMNPYIKFLQEHKTYHRVVSGDGILMPNFASVFEIYDVRYINSLSPVTYQNYVDNYLLKIPKTIPEHRLWFTGIPDQYREKPPSIYEELKYNFVFYSFLGVKYILAPKEITLNLPLVYDKEIKIYENPSCLPRVFIAHKIEYASSYIEAQKMMSRSGFDLRNTVILEEKISQGYDELTSIDCSNAMINDYQPNKVIIEAHLESPGILVLTDVFYPGWEAYIDNNPAKIYRVNGLVRGVFIEKGRHTIVFKYYPASFRLGLWITGLCILLCASLIFKEKIATKF